MRNVMRNWMLGTALVAGLLGTGAVAANAAPQEFHGRPEQGNYRGSERGDFRRPQRGPEGGFQRGYERRDGGYYGGGGYGYAGGGPVVGAYASPYPGDGYVWLNGGWVFRGRPEVAYGYGYRGAGRFDRGYGRGFDRGHGFEGGRGVERGERGRR